MKQVYNFILLFVTCAFFFSCQGDELGTENVGYLRVALEQSAEVNTKADTYEPKQMRVVIKNAEGVTKFETNDHTEDVNGKEISLAPGEYTIEAVSNAWDGNSGANRAYYTGKTTATIVKGQTATATLVCSLANVKVTVAFEESFLKKLGEGTIKVQVKSTNAAVGAIDFDPKSTNKVVYFPISDLTVAYTVTSAEGKTNSGEQSITDVKGKDHYILNFKDKGTGTGNITVTVDPSMNQYTYDFKVDPNSKDGATLSANPWSKLVYLAASDIVFGTGELTALKFQYSAKGTEQWTDVETSMDAASFAASATLTGLTPATAYEYRLTDGTGEVARGEFKTEEATALINGSLDGWSDNEPNADTNNKFWDTSNKGASMGGLTPTQAVTDFVHTSGGKAAKLESGMVNLMGGIFAAASLYTGSFGSTDIWTQTATVNFGQPFTSRPIALKGFYKYTPKVINLVKNIPSGVTIVKDETIDQCAIYIALAKKTFTIDNGDQSSFINFKDNSNIIAYGELPSGAATDGDGYAEFNIPLKYKNLTDQPTHIIVVCSSSKYGDYMTGGAGSTLYVDDLSLIYDGTPTIWE